MIHESSQLHGRTNTAALRSSTYLAEGVHCDLNRSRAVLSDGHFATVSEDVDRRQAHSAALIGVRGYNTDQCHQAEEREHTADACHVGW